MYNASSQPSSAQCIEQGASRHLKKSKAWVGHAEIGAQCYLVCVVPLQVMHLTSPSVSPV